MLLCDAQRFPQVTIINSLQGILMALNRSKGQMYPWVTHTWNPIRGKCPHECVYCYMNRFPQGELRFEKCLQDNLGEGNTIFVGSSTDMWANEVPTEWIEKVLHYCSQKNQFLFQMMQFYNGLIFHNYI